MEAYQIGALAVAVPFIGAAFVPVAAAFGDRARAWFAVLFGFITAFFTLLLTYNIQPGAVGGYDWIPYLDIRLGILVDGISVAVAAIAGVIGALVLLFSVKYMEEATGEGYSLSRYYSLVLLFIGAMIGLALTDNLLVLYVFWEIVGFCSYALIAYYYKEPKATWAGLKAFVTTRIGDTGFLIGIIILWWCSKTLNINEIIAMAPSLLENYPCAMGLAGAGFILGAIGKSAQVPLHVWLPDAMEAPTTISALIHAATMVNAGVYLLARSYPIFEGLGWWLPAIAWVGAITAFLTATMALAEPDLKRVLAYSTISQLGYMMTAIGVGAVLASQFHLFSHAIFKALLFLCAGAVIHTVGTRNMYEMGGLGARMLWTNVCFMVGTLALIGIPIFNGFWSKDFVLVEAYTESIENTWIYGPLLLLILGAFATAAYSLRMYWLVFMGKRRVPTKVGRDWEVSAVARGLPVRDAPIEMTFPLIVLALMAILSWLIIPLFSNSFVISVAPGYHIEKLIHLDEFIIHTFTTPMIAVTGIVILLALYLGFAYKSRLETVFKAPTPLNLTLQHAYGFDIFYGGITESVRGFAREFRRIQTGDLNYNLVYVALGLMGLFLLLMWKGGL
jgi:NADH-quinone oxidoreductase subunit L